MTEPEHIRNILPRVVSRLGGRMSHTCTDERAHAGDASTCPDCIAKLGVELAEAVRAYQAALSDPAYWTEPLGQSQQRVSETFDRMVALATQILEER